MPYLFYARRFNSEPLGDLVRLIDGYAFKIWRPDISMVMSRDLPVIPYFVWWCFHYLHIFSNRDYAIATVYDGSMLVHRSVVFPPYFRFPFMKKDDLQIGDTWTHPKYRNRGLAAFTLQKIVETFDRPGRTFWYVVEQENSASVRVAEKAGFLLLGKGDRTKRLGIRLLGSFVIQQSNSSGQ